MKNLSHSRTLPARLFAAALLVASAASVLAAVRYVDVNSANPTPPYSSWAAAAATVQTAVDAAVQGDEITRAASINGRRGKKPKGKWGMSARNHVAPSEELS